MTFDLKFSHYVEAMDLKSLNFRILLQAVPKI